MFVAALLAALCASAQAETVTAVGGRSVEGRIVELDASGNLVVEPARRGEAERLPLADLVEIRFAEAAEGPATDEPSAPREILMENGDRLLGDVLRIEKESLAVVLPRLGRLSAPLESVRGVLHPRRGVAEAIWARARAEVAADEGPAEDVLLLASGDRAAGIVKRLDAGRLELDHRALGKRVTVDLHDVIGLRFARLGAPAAAEKFVTAIVETRDGSRFSGKLVAAGSEKLRISWCGQELSVPTREISRVSFRGGRLSWLSEMEPAAEKAQPLLGPAFKAARDRTTGGRALIVAGRTFRRGVAVRSRSELTWKLDGAYAAFESFIGIDDESGAGGEGSVRFRVLVDGVEKYASPVVRGGEPARFVRVDLAGAKEITLRVEEADEMDLADHADWAEARLIKPEEKKK